MARELLTVKQLEAYKGDPVLRDGNGLMLRGSRWVLRVRAHGQHHDLGLGSWPEVARRPMRPGSAPNADVTRSVRRWPHMLVWVLAAIPIYPMFGAEAHVTPAWDLVRGHNFG
jgi:hypothetical protein